LKLDKVIGWLLISISLINLGGRLGVINLPDLGGVLGGVVATDTSALEKEATELAKACKGSKEQRAVVAETFLAAAAFDSKEPGTDVKQMDIVRDKFKELDPDFTFAWVDFRNGITKALRKLREEGKVSDTAASHVPYMRAIAKGVTNSGG
jgi:hypothetical protein